MSICAQNSSDSHEIGQTRGTNTHTHIHTRTHAKLFLHQTGTQMRKQKYGLDLTTGAMIGPEQEGDTQNCSCNCFIVE